ncbi:MAG: hypothetical protein ACI90V_010805 [Bacillariaceae sp.]|jgi:hypothetical protein
MSAIDVNSFKLTSSIPFRIIVPAGIASLDYHFYSHTQIGIILEFINKQFDEFYEEK